MLNVFVSVFNVPANDNLKIAFCSLRFHAQTPPSINIGVVNHCMFVLCMWSK